MSDNLDKKKDECLYHKENDSCRMESDLKCRDYDNGLCPLKGNIEGKNVKTQYESQTARFTFAQLMNGLPGDF